jgi:hypothetical protein
MGTDVCHTNSLTMMAVCMPPSISPSPPPPAVIDGGQSRSAVVSGTPPPPPYADGTIYQTVGR